MSRPVPVLLVLPLALGVAASGCGPARAGGAAAQEDAVVTVRTVRVARGPVSVPIRATGTLGARDAWSLGFRQGGRVAAVHVEAGERVRRGQAVATLDALDVAAQVRQAREARDKAARDAARVRALRAEDAVAAAAAQDAETGLQVAEEALRAAEFAAARTVLAAPEDGHVDARLVEPGEVVGPGQPVLRISGRRRGLVVRAALPERDVLGLAAGRAATVTLPARPGPPIAARVTEVGRLASRGTGTYDVEVALDPAAAPADLPSGLTARVEIAREVAAEAAVPLAAVQEGDGETGVVYALEGDRARRVPVRIAFLAGDRAVVASGLAGVDSVVVEGAPRLGDGVRVRSVP